MSIPEAAVDPYVPERGNLGYRVVRYDLDLGYAVASNLLRGRARVTVVPDRSRSDLTFDLVGLRVGKVTVGARPARWQQRSGKLRVVAEAPVEAGAEAVVEVHYRGNPRPTRSRWGPVGWEELDDGVLVAAQPSGACTWFPCNDLAGQKASFRVAVTAPSAYRVVASGVLRSRTPGGSTTTWVYEQEEPTSPYLVALHVGRYEQHDLAGGPVPIRAYVPSKLSGPFGAAFARQVAMVDLFVDRFGPYPFASGYAVVVTPDPLEVPLEAQGQAVFGPNHLGGGDERLIAHELAHQWFGNSVTAGAWRDVWLHEGFACYAEWLWSEASGGPSAAAEARRHRGRLARLPQDRVLADPGPDEMFEDWVYKRGALTLHALRGEVGDVAFFALLRRWATDGRHGVVATEGFEAMAAEVGGRPLGGLFDRWLRERALPEVSEGP